jgi:hypothetical protein
MQNTTTDRPATSAGDLYYPIDVTPEQFFQAWSRSEREALIELLIDTLDSTDGCDEDSAVDDRPCDEDPDAEPPLGWTDLESRWGNPVVTEGEDEPILGSVVATDQTKWASSSQDDREGDGCADDREDECEDEGAQCEDEGSPDADKEPSLGWCESIRQSVPKTSAEGCDLEQGESARPPQNRTDLRTTLVVEKSYRKFVRGLTDSQRTAVRARMHHDSSVVLR